MEKATHHLFLTEPQEKALHIGVPDGRQRVARTGRDRSFGIAGLVQLNLGDGRGADLAVK